MNLSIKAEAPPAAGNKLQLEARELIWQLQQSREESGIYSELVRLGRDCGLPPAPFARLLVKQGLSAPRASEIKCILENEGIRDAFLAEQGPISLREAIRAARGIRLPGKGTKPPPNPEPLLKNFQRFMRELLELSDQENQGPSGWSILSGIYRMTYVPGTAGEPSQITLS